MPKLEIYRLSKKICEIQANPGDTLLQAISDAGVYLDAPCGGAGRCGKCLVYSEPDGEELLACRTYIDGDMRIFLPDETKMKIADSFGTSDFYAIRHSGCACPELDSGTHQSPKPPGNSERLRLGFAIDVGTTTVVASLIDCETGRVLATASGVNAQRVYGADVISRINYSATNGYEKLTRLIRSQIETLILQLLSSKESAHIEQPQIENIVIAGNTIMQHLVAGYSPVGMGTVPFMPESLFGEEYPPWEGLPVSPDAKIYYPPAIAAYVGGDITAGILAVEEDFNFVSTGNKVDGQTNPNFCYTVSEVKNLETTMLFLDIGTNGEMVLRHRDKYYTCATAAGPAFEGAQIEMGMAATSGAISHAEWNEEENRLELTVIDEAKPIGICGSGLLDILAYLVENGKVANSENVDSCAADSSLPFVDETGRLIVGASGSNSREKYYLTDSVYITSEDIRKLQLAKAAIAAGIQTLLESAGITENQIDTLILAGGFGNYLDKKSAAKIGLIPESLLSVTQAAGNTALRGAKHILCNKDARAKPESIRERTKYIELSTSKVFNEQFIEQMMF